MILGIILTAIPLWVMYYYYKRYEKDENNHLVEEKLLELTNMDEQDA